MPNGVIILTNHACENSLKYREHILWGGLMAGKKIDSKELDKILEKMVETVDNSKDEIFHIGEQSRQEFETLELELTQIKTQVKKTISDADKLEIHTKFARKRLSEVSRNFHDFSEEEIRNAYEKAHTLQMELTMIRELEKQLRNRRDEIERRLLGLKETIERAEHLGSQVTVILNYLNGDMRQVGEILEDAEEKQEFGLKIIEAQEEERKKLSREIHDGPAQMLANVMMRSQILDRTFRESGVDAALQEIHDLRKMVRLALYEVRRIIYDLRPMALDDLGLIPTLKKYLATIEEYNGKTKISFQNIGDEARLKSKQEVAFFRLAQEAVQNSLKHANAKNIYVKIEVGKKKIVLCVKDDGKGFDPEYKKKNSFGLLGMKERVELMEGQMTVISKSGVGTSVIIQVPLHNK